MRLITLGLQSIGKKVALLLAFSFLPLLSSAQFKVDRLILSGRIALHYEDYVLSIQLFNQAISQKPYLWEPWQLRAIAKYYLEDWRGAEADASKAIELNPYITSLYDLRGIARIRQENYTDAIADYTLAIAQEPTNQNFWYNRAACLVELKEYDAAQEQLDTILKKWSGNAAAYLLRAETYMHQKDTITAEQWIEKSLAVDSFNATAWRVRASLAMSKERYADADNYFSRALHLKPKDAISLVNRAVARIKLNNLRGAMSDYDDALTVQPNNFLAHYNRGLLRQHVGDDNRAIEDFDYVLTYEPNNYLALFNRATLLDRTGDLHGAIRDYTRVIEQFPNFWTGLRYRAECYRKLGMTAAAERDEFRILKAQLDKRQGIQQRWTKSKIAATRKMSDVDPEKYNQIVVEDEAESTGDYKSEYRGRVQNRQVAERYLPYLALSISDDYGASMKTKTPSALTKYRPFDPMMDDFSQSVTALAQQLGISVPTLGAVGEGVGVQTTEAIERLSSALENANDRKERLQLLLMRSVAHSSAQDYQSALADIDAYMVDDDQSFIALWQRAVCGAMTAEYTKSTTTQEEQMRISGVKGDFDRLLSRENDNAFVHYCYGTFLARMGDVAAAEKHLSRAIELNPTLPQAYYNRGLLFLNIGKTTESRQDFSKAGELGLYNAYSLMKNRLQSSTNNK